MISCSNGPKPLRADDDEADIDAFEHGARLADAQRAEFADIVKTGRIDKTTGPSGDSSIVFSTGSVVVPAGRRRSKWTGRSTRSSASTCRCCDGQRPMCRRNPLGVSSMCHPAA